VGWDTPKRDTTKIIAVVPVRCNVSDSLEAVTNVKSMVVKVEDRRGVGIGYWENGARLL